ncbi:MAG: hypothetical protein ACK4PK_07410 [Alphaproteobacteria bacterium]
MQNKEILQREYNKTNREPAWKRRPMKSIPCKYAPRQMRLLFFIPLICAPQPIQTWQSQSHTGKANPAFKNKQPRQPCGCALTFANSKGMLETIATTRLHNACNKTTE